MNTIWQYGLQTITENLTPFEASTLHNLLNVNDVQHSVTMANEDQRSRLPVIITYPTGASELVRTCILRAKARAAALAKAA